MEVINGVSYLGSGLGAWEHVAVEAKNRSAPVETLPQAVRSMIGDGVSNVRRRNTHLCDIRLFHWPWFFYSHCQHMQQARLKSLHNLSKHT